jgi:hypothetical protein
LTLIAGRHRQACRSAPTNQHGLGACRIGKVTALNGTGIIRMYFAGDQAGRPLDYRSGSGEQTELIT